MSSAAAGSEMVYSAFPVDTLRRKAIQGRNNTSDHNLMSGNAPVGVPCCNLRDQIPPIAPTFKRRSSESELSPVCQAPVKHTRFAFPEEVPCSSSEVFQSVQESFESLEISDGPGVSTSQSNSEPLTSTLTSHDVASASNDGPVESVMQPCCCRPAVPQDQMGDEDPSDTETEDASSGYRLCHWRGECHVIWLKSLEGHIQEHLNKDRIRYPHDDPSQSICHWQDGGSECGERVGGGVKSFVRHIKTGHFSYQVRWPRTKFSGH